MVTKVVDLQGPDKPVYITALALFLGVQVMDHQIRSIVAVCA